MIKHKILQYILLLALASVITSEVPQQNAKSKEEMPQKAPDKLVLQKSEPYSREEPSIMSRISNWLFSNPEKSSDLLASPDKFNAPQYLPPPSSYQRDRACNPCNQEPWIPVAAQAGRNTLIGFIPPSSHSSGHGTYNLNELDGLNPPLPSYEIQQSSKPHSQYGPPKTSQFGATPSSQYGSPLSSGYGPPPSSEYGPPPSSEYGPPPGSKFGSTPSSKYGPPPSSEYGPPPSSEYGPPPASKFGSTPSSKYGPPPSLEYGPPPSSEYGPPPGSKFGSTPPSKYGPPPSLVYGPPPSSEYGPPPSPEYGIPTHHNIERPLSSNFIAPPPSLYSSPSLAASHGPQLPSYKPAPIFRKRPSKSYHPHKGGFHSRPSHPSKQSLRDPPYGLSDYMVPPPLNQLKYGLPPSASYGVPANIHSPQNPIPTTYLQPVLAISDYIQPPPSSQHSVLHENFPPFPSGSVSNHHGNAETNDPYIRPIEQLPLSSGDNDDEIHNLRPIPLPNLSSHPVVPIHSYHEFNRGFSSHESHNNEPNIQILPSVQIANFLSSVEHPINVIQSPLVELNVRDETLEDEKKKTSLQDQKYEANQGVPQGVIPGHSSSVFNNEHKLSENPIVVEDTFTAASNVNDTYREKDTYKRGNDEHYLQVVPNLIQPDINNVAGIKHSQNANTNQDQTSIGQNVHSADITELLQQHGISQSQIIDIHPVEHNNTKFNDNNPLFTPPPMDYSQWTPSWNKGVSTEMVPPPMKSTWLLPVEQIGRTTKKPKQVQIIIPYVNNHHKPTGFANNNNNWSLKSGIKKTRHDVRTQTDSYRGSYTTLLPVYSPPPTTYKSVWDQFINDFELAESKKVVASAFQEPPSPYNIQDVLKDTKLGMTPKNLPFDIISLQKNIHDWTQQEYSNHKTTVNYVQENNINSKLGPSKNIPDEYLTTLPYDTTTIKIGDSNDFLSAGSDRQESTVLKDIETNLISDDSTTEEVSTTTMVTSTMEHRRVKSQFTLPYSATSEPPHWNIADVTVSPITKEKVYIVTPAAAVKSETTTRIISWSAPPKVENDTGLAYANSKFLIRVEAGRNFNRTDDMKDNSTVKVVFSEWPHRINNLQATTSKPTSRHPLFGLMDISSYTPPPNGTIQTISGHSKVVSSVTPSNVVQKKTAKQFDKMQT